MSVSPGVWSKKHVKISLDEVHTNPHEHKAARVRQQSRDRLYHGCLTNATLHLAVLEVPNVRSHENRQALCHQSKCGNAFNNWFPVIQCFLHGEWILLKLLWHDSIVERSTTNNQVVGVGELLQQVDDDVEDI